MSIGSAPSTVSDTSTQTSADVSLPSRRHPEWIRARMPGTARFQETSTVLRRLGLVTVCEEAKCPNIGDCYAHSTATFMILGNLCTRRCTFCAVPQENPHAAHPDPTEPARLAHAVSELGLNHVVITSVTRDDLPDQGASHFVACVDAIRHALPAVRIEILTPDFRGELRHVASLVKTSINVFNHNMETVPRLYERVRPGARYDRSLRVLKAAKETRADLLTKSGLMLGLGETREEVIEVARELRENHCDILTLGQYLQPSGNQLPVEKYIHPDEFADLKAAALELGFRHVESGPLVRSSYHAWAQV